MPSGNIVYEVQATVAEAVAASWELYMQSEHIPDVIAAGEFLGASLERGGGGRYRIRYLARDQARLAHYRESASPRLRQAASDRFPEGVELGRDEWQVVATWG